MTNRWLHRFILSLVAAAIAFCVVKIYAVKSETLITLSRSEKLPQRPELSQLQYDADMERLKKEFQLEPGQDELWTHLEIALQQSSNEFMNIPLKMFEQKNGLLERIELVAGANPKSASIQNLCQALRSLFYKSNDNQRIVLERRILPVSTRE